MILLTGQIEGLSTRADDTWKVIIGTQELTPQKVGELSSLKKKFVYMAFKVEDFESQEIEAVEGLKADYEDKGISHSKRQRNILYRLWEMDNEGYEDFEKYYDFHMNKLNNWLKSKLP